jgi:hypothetical protein
VSVPFPTSIKISSFRFDLDENKAQTESIFTRQRQVVTLAGGTADRWVGFIQTPELSPADVDTLFDFLVEVGLYGRFTIGNPDYSGPLSGATSGLVLGAGQSGTSLIVDGVAASTLIVRKGEYFQVRDEYKKVAANAPSNGSGEVTIPFKPALRVSPADNDPVIFNTPVLLLELMSIPSRLTDDLNMGAFTIPFQEALVGV